MKPLVEDFIHDGFTLRQLARDGDVALFKKSKPGHSCPGYEVVVVQCHPAQTIHGREYPERESMPPSESWGILGWSYSNENSAKTKFHELLTSRAKAHSVLTPFPTGASPVAGGVIPNTSPPGSPREKG